MLKSKAGSSSPKRIPPVIGNPKNMTVIAASRPTTSAVLLPENTIQLANSTSNSVSPTVLNSKCNDQHFPMFWKEVPHHHDKNLRNIMYEIALKTSPNCINMLLVEQKRDRLIDAYVILHTRSTRAVITNQLENTELSDFTRYQHLCDLFEINYFHSDSHQEYQKKANQLKGMHKLRVLSHSYSESDLITSSRMFAGKQQSALFNGYAAPKNPQDGYKSSEKHKSNDSSPNIKSTGGVYPESGGGKVFSPTMASIRRADSNLSPTTNSSYFSPNQRSNLKINTNNTNNTNSTPKKLHTNRNAGLYFSSPEKSPSQSLPQSLLPSSHSHNQHNQHNHNHNNTHNAHNTHHTHNNHHHNHHTHHHQHQPAVAMDKKRMYYLSHYQQSVVEEDKHDDDDL